MCPSVSKAYKIHDKKYHIAAKVKQLQVLKIIPTNSIISVSLMRMHETDRKEVQSKIIFLV